MSEQENPVPLKVARPFSKAEKAVQPAVPYEMKSPTQVTQTSLPADTVPPPTNSPTVGQQPHTNGPIPAGTPHTNDETKTARPPIGEPSPLTAVAAHPTEEKLDEEEQEFRALRRDLPGVKGASATGIVSIGVAKIPGKNEFFRTLPGFAPTFAIVNHEVGMDKHYFAVTDSMVAALSSIGITVTDHTLYLTVTARGAYKLIPVIQANEDGDQNEYARTKEIGMVEGVDRWVRLYTDLENHCYKVFPEPGSKDADEIAKRFGEPKFPALKPAKTFRLAFRDKGRLIDSPQHPLFQKWAGRDL